MAHRIHSHTANRVQPQVKPGEALGFVGKMRDQGVWPPPAGRHRLHPGPTVTPFVVLRTSGADDGTRPISLEEAAHSESINIVDSDSGDAVTNPVPGQTYRLRCVLSNLGAAGAYGGVAEFYVAQPEDFDNAATTPGPARIPAKGYAGFATLPGTTSTVECPNLWTPTSDLEAASTVLVQAYDPFIDPLNHPFNAPSDRHVGRLDTLPIFRGTWDGAEHVPFQPQPIVPGEPSPAVLAFRLRLVIAQNRLDLNVSVFQEIQPGRGLPGNPQHILATRISSGLARLNYTDSPSVGRLPRAFHQYTCRLTARTSMKIEHRIHFTADEGIDKVLVGDLVRTSA